jgi:Zn-dependent protease
MRGGGLKIGRVFGIPIYLHTSWFLIFGLITLSLAGEFAYTNPSWTDNQRWGLGLVTSLLFFGSVLFHELSHSVVALRYRLPVNSITLFIFGGVAQISREPDMARQEFLIAAAGPFSSYVLAGTFFLLGHYTSPMSMPSVLGYWLARINFGLATFNLVPGFPLDGGRLLRSVVWGYNKNYTRATYVAARSGQIIAWAMILRGLSVAIAPGTFGSHILGGYLGEDPISGLWLAFIGWFLLSTARMSYAQASLRGALDGLNAADIMTSEITTVGRDLSLEEYARQVAATGQRLHLVVADGRLAGLVSLDALQRVPREEWAMTSVQAVMLPRESLQLASPDEPATELLDRMRSAAVEQMAVVNGGNVVGVITRDSVQRILQARHDVARLSNR